MPEAITANDLRIEAGSPHPLGATPTAAGVNFSLFSASADYVELLLFATHRETAPFATVVFDPHVNKTYHYWHAHIRGLRPGVLYAYRVDGPNEPQEGHRFDRAKVLIDPYSKGNNNNLWLRADACQPGGNLATSMRSVVINTAGYDWEGDRPLRRPMEESIIYELHVRGFTASPTSGVRHPGTFSGIIERIDYLKNLGITAVELMPVFDFDETDVVREVNGRPLRNYWGYSPIGFLAPQSSYCVSPSTGAHLTEFRDMVKALHRAGIEVILDVVFNHTAEGDHLGPYQSFRGIDNRTYYCLTPHDRRFYLDFTGCGNTFNCNHPIAQKLILDSLRFWVREMHVDGFRFDLASVMVRGEDGAPLKYPPVVWQIELDDTLVHTKVIAEAWDIGLYQVGHYPGQRWAEWNGMFRDDMRRFVRGDPGRIGVVATRLAGSSDLFEGNGELPSNSINFVTAHDGFTLRDLVSYDHKHNEGNGEGNRDGTNDNLSWNCGVEGPSDDPAIEALRLRQMKNFATLLLIARGVPMLLMGDEISHTQRGNNNAYCQDNEISWLDWDAVNDQRDLLRFWRHMIAFRRRHRVLWMPRFYSGELIERGLADVTWHGVRLNQPGWDDPHARALAVTIAGIAGDADLHVMMNMYWEPLDFEVPTVPSRRWYKAVETSAAPPADIFEAGDEPEFDGSVCRVPERSITILLAR